MTNALPPLADAAAMAVHADLLSEVGDPRGTLVHLQLALEGRPGDARLLEAERRHLAAHARALLGRLALHQSVARFSWHRGYVVRADFRSVTTTWWGPHGKQTEPDNRLARAMRALTSLPHPEHLQSLSLSQPWSNVVVRHLDAAVRTLARLDLPLRELSVALTDEPPDPWFEERTGLSRETVSFTVGALTVECDARVEGVVRRALD